MSQFIFFLHIQTQDLNIYIYTPLFHAPPHHTQKINWSTPNWTMEVLIPIFHIYPKRTILFWMYPYKLWFHCPLTIQNHFCFIKKIYHKKKKKKKKKKIDTGKQNQCSTVPTGWNLDLNRLFPQTDRVEIQCMCQSRYIALSCKISLISRQRTTKTLIRLRGCAGWSAPLLFTYDKNRFSHDVAHFQINRSYLCRIIRKRVCCIQFYGEKQLLIYHGGGVIFAEDLLKINLLWLRLYVWGTVPCVCLCSGQKVF